MFKAMSLELAILLIGLYMDFMALFNKNIVTKIFLFIKGLLST